MSTLCIANALDVKTSRFDSRAVGGRLSKFRGRCEKSALLALCTLISSPPHECGIYPTNLSLARTQTDNRTLTSTHSTRLFHGFPFTARTNATGVVETNRRVVTLCKICDHRHHAQHRHGHHHQLLNALLHVGASGRVWVEDAMVMMVGGGHHAPSRSIVQCAAYRTP